MVIDEPQSAFYSGGLAAAPVFSVIARQALLNYDVAPGAVGWTQPANGTNLRARPAEAAPIPDPFIVMALAPGCVADRAMPVEPLLGMASRPLIEP